MINKIKSAFAGLCLDEWLVLLSMATLLLPEAVTAVLLILLTVFALLSRKRREKMRAMPGFAPAVLMLFVFMLPVVFEPSYVTLVLGLGLWLMLMLMLYISSVMTARLSGLIMDLLLVLGAISALYGLFDHFFIKSMVAGDLRTASIFENANHYGYAIELFAFVSVCRFWQTKKPVYLVMLAVSACSNFLCDCRAAWVAIAAGLIVMIPFAVKNKRRLALVFLLGLVGCGVMAVVLPQLSDRLSYEAISVSFGRRLKMWDNAIGWIKESPILGHGVGSYIPLSKQGNVRELMHAHNLLLNILLDIGVLGLLGGAVLGVRIAARPFGKAFIAQHKEITALITATVTATLVHGLIDFPVFAVSTGYLFFLTIALGASAETKAFRQ